MLLHEWTSDPELCLSRQDVLPFALFLLAVLYSASTSQIPGFYESTAHPLCQLVAWGLLVVPSSMDRSDGAKPTPKERGCARRGVLMVIYAMFHIGDVNRIVLTVERVPRCHLGRCCSRPKCQSCRCRATVASCSSFQKLN